MDPATIHALVKAGKVALAPAVKNFVQRLPKANDEAFDKSRRETFEDWTVEVAIRSQQQYEYLSARLEGLEASVASLANDVACMRLAANYARAADSEPTPERLRMLAFADAALIDSRLTVAKHSRVERILRELDPDDVLWLDVLEKVVGVRRGADTFPHQDALRWSVWNDCPASDILVASACVRTRHVGGGAGAADWDGAVVTTEGRLVLHVLRLYVRVSPPTAMGTIFTEITDARTPFGGAAGRPRRREGLHGRKDLVSTPLIWARPGSDCRRFGVGFKLGCEGLDSSFRRGGRLRCAR
jgi:hypothetical protein